MARSARSGGGAGDDKPEGVAADEPLAEWERDLYQPAGTQQSDSSPQTAAEAPLGDNSGGEAGAVAVAIDEDGPTRTAAEPQPNGSSTS
jgi:small subunit ribosomal protein S2